MFKILLINPTRQNIARLKTPRTINVDLGSISSFPPIGLMYLAQAVRMRNSAFEVRILDAVAGGLTHKDVIERVLKYSPNIVGITAHTYTFYDVWGIANMIKTHMPHIPVAVGGSHMYIFARETMIHKCFDYGVAGDGENVFARLCEELYGHKEITLQRGLYFRNGSEILGSGIALEQDLDAIAFPAIDLIDTSRYYNTLGNAKSVGTICTSRGCPFHCTFCQVPHVPYRLRSIQHVMEEIEKYIEQGITDFFFFDDLFNVDKKRVVEFCEETLRRNLKIGFMFRGRVGMLDDEALKLAYRAGCHTISVGIEDATDEGLKSIKKRITIGEAFEYVRLVRRNKIKCSTNWIIGFPHHRAISDLRHLLNTALKMGADYAQFGILQCLPGTELFNEAVRQGGIPFDAWENYVRNPVPDFEPPIWEKHFSKNYLYEFYEHCYKRYYLSPKIVIREILNVKSWDDFKRKLNSFNAVFLKKHAA